MSKLAFLTIGVLNKPGDDPQIQSFWDRVDGAFQAAENSEGFLGRSIFDDVREQESWGNWTVPSCFKNEEYTDLTPSTLSLWRDLESVFAFAYNGLHAEALSKRREWFIKSDWPTYAAWWVADDHTPTWQEASEKHDKLYQDGPSPEVFTFRQPYGPDGQPVQIDREAVRQKALAHQQDG